MLSTVQVAFMTSAINESVDCISHKPITGHAFSGKKKKDSWLLNFFFKTYEELFFNLMAKYMIPYKETKDYNVNRLDDKERKK